MSGSRTWYLPLTGDGGDSGFDAVVPDIHFHTYTGGQLDINYHGNDPATWLWIGDKLSSPAPESFRFYSPAIADPVVTKTLFIGGRTSGARPTSAATERSSSSTATRLPASSAPATGSSPASAGPTGSRSARRH